ncbi:MAG TPA: CoA transferase, partial [Acidimicrobiales bacterium]
DEVVARMTENEVPCAPVVDLVDVHAHPQVVAAGVLEETDHPVLGRLRQPRPAAPMGATARRPAPAAGEHTDEILAEAGFEADEISRLRRDAVIA